MAKPKRPPRYSQATYRAAQIHVRDALLAEIIRKLTRRRDTRPMAQSVQRIVSLITTLEAEDRLPDAAKRLTQVVMDRIDMFAARTGKEKPPSPRLRPLKMTLLRLTGFFRDLDAVPPPRLAIDEAWREYLGQPGSPQGTDIDAVLAARTPTGQAEQLLYAVHGRPDETFEQFRRTLARVKIKLPV